MIKNSKLIESGFLLSSFPIGPIVGEWIKNKDWKSLDQYFLDISKPGGALFCFLFEFLDFTTLEHIISIRKSPDDEDGIWHDDGSRFLGFSLSLNLEPTHICGGELRFKKKDSSQIEIFAPRPYGEIILFLSGIYGYEHMVSAVDEGERIVIAGWCS